MSQETHDRIAKALSVGVHRIVFRKKDGSMRTMRATRDPELMPESCKTPEGSASKQKPNYDVVNVVDLDIGQWRRFAIDSLIEPDVDELLARGR